MNRSVFRFLLGHNFKMYDEDSPTVTKFGTFCRPEMLMQGMLHECHVAGDKPFAGCPFAQYSGKYRFCNHPTLHQSDIQTSNPEPEKTRIRSDYKLDFDLSEVIGKLPPAAPEPSAVPPRTILREKYPDILNRVELMWGSIELHKYLRMLTSDHSNSHRFPPDVIQALSKLNLAHRSVLKAKGIIHDGDLDALRKE